MKKSTVFYLDCLNVLFSFIVSRWLFMTYLSDHALAIFTARLGNSTEVVTNLFLILVMASFNFVILRLFYIKKLNIVHVFFLYLVYFVLLFYLLFLKNIGLQGFELNPLTYFDGVTYGYWFEPIMNLIMFMPLALLFKMTKKRALIAFIGLLSIEIIQYVGHIGVFDIGDLLANCASLALGQLARQGLLKMGLRDWLGLGNATGKDAWKLLLKRLWPFKSAK